MSDCKARRRSAFVSAFICALFLLITLAARTSAQTVWHVDDDAPAQGDGLQWSSAFPALQSALDVAMHGDQIWVAQGRYLPSTPTNPTDPRTATFRVSGQIALYGGFLGTETSVAQRAGSFRLTELDGDIGIADDPSDNAYHVVTVMGTVTIDGFSIHGGRAIGAPSPGSVGAGILCATATGVHLHLTHTIVSDNVANQGAGMYAQLGLVYLKWCTFTANTSNLGGATYLMTSTALIYHTRFESNHANQNGGAIFLSSIGWDSAHGPMVVFVNCAFHGNSAIKGGAAYLGGSQYTAGNAAWYQCTFAYNHAASAGGALYAVTASHVPAHSFLYNSIVWANDAPVDAQISGRDSITYSDVQDGTQTGDDGNIDVDPLFRDGPGGDLQLLAGSPGIDAANNALVPYDMLDIDGNQVTFEPIPLDLAGGPRFVDDLQQPDTGCCGAPIVDMGAFEAQ